MFHALDRPPQVAGVDIAVELDPYGMRHRVFQPGDRRGGEPIADLAVELRVQVAGQCFQVRTISQYGPFEAEADHADFLVVGEVEDALGVVEVIGIELPMLRHGAADSLREAGGLRASLVQRRVQAWHRTQWQAIKRYIDVIAHHGSISPASGERGNDEGRNSALSTTLDVALFSLIRQSTYQQLKILT